MKFISGQFKKILVMIALMLPAAVTLSQGRHSYISAQRKSFEYQLSQANINFRFPEGFREIKAVNSEDFPFDYAIELPGQDFEIWFHAQSLKRNWILYAESTNDSNKLENPDSTYIQMGQAQARAFTGGDDYIVRPIPPEVLAQYNADAGKTYLLNLLDLPETKHYRYALLITLQKHHVGNLMAVCFTNNKNPEFFKNMKRAAKCIKFKPLK